LEEIISKKKLFLVENRKNWKGVLEKGRFRVSKK